MTRRCRYRATRPDPSGGDLVRRLRGLLVIVAVPLARGTEAVRRDDELLDRVAADASPIGRASGATRCSSCGTVRR